MIELAAHDEVDVLARVERRVGLHLDVRADKCHFEARAGEPHLTRQPQVALKAGRRREQDDELVVTRNPHRFGRGDLVRRGVEEAAAFEHARRVRQPDRIPVLRFDFPRRRPAGAGAPPS